MFKNKIYKYFTIEITKSFLTILFALTAIAWTVRAVNFLDLVVENGHSMSTYLYFSALNITNIITKFIPLSFLLSLVLSIFKFHRQNELIILWTTGLNKIKLVHLFFLISLFVLLIQILFAVFITPNALNKSRSLIRTSGLDSMNAVIRANNFSDTFKNLTFFIQSKNENNEMENIFIRDNSSTFQNLVSNKGDSTNTTIVAKKGFIKDQTLILEDGLIQTQSKDGEIDNLNFDRTELLLTSFAPRTTTVPKLQETLTSSLIKCLLVRNRSDKISNLDNCPKTNLKKDMIETISRRVGMPLYIPLVTLICSFLLISINKNKFKLLYRYIYFLISFIILILAEILVRFSGFSDLNTISYFLFPLILMPLVYLFLIQKFTFEKIKP